MPNRLIATPARANAVLLVCAVLFFLSMLASGFALIERFNQTNERRNDQAHINADFRHTLVSLLCFSRNFSLNVPGVPPERVARLNLYYTGALARIDATTKEC